MGSKDLFHKKRERTANDLKRQKATPSNPARQPQPRILIVCEDSKSSAYYLQDLSRELGLNAVKVEGERCGSAPKSVLEYAQKLYVQSKQDGDAYDRVYCVFDRDQHPCFDITAEEVKSLRPKNTFLAVTTTPCFEFWLLLHFAPNAKPYHATQNKSPCDNANSDLKSYWVNYGKSRRDIYTFTKDKTQTAITFAKQLANDNIKTGSNNPQTNMHELIEYLQSIKR